MNQENYNITLKEAKRLKEYKFVKNIEISEFKSKLKDKSFNIYEIDVPFQIEFGYIDIELTVRDEDYLMDYFICIKDSTGWKSFDCADEEVNLDNINTIEELEAKMFGILMYEAKKHNLHWSKPNN